MLKTTFLVVILSLSFPSYSYAINKELINALLNCTIKTDVRYAYNHTEEVFEGLEKTYAKNMFDKNFRSPENLTALSINGRDITVSENSIMLIISKENFNLGAFIKKNKLKKTTPMKDFPTYYFFERTVRPGARLIANHQAPDYSDKLIIGCAYDK